MEKITEQEMKEAKTMLIEEALETVELQLLKETTPEKAMLIQTVLLCPSCHLESCPIRSLVEKAKPLLTDVFGDNKVDTALDEMHRLIADATFEKKTVHPVIATVVQAHIMCPACKEECPTRVKSEAKLEEYAVMFAAYRREKKKNIPQVRKQDFVAATAGPEVPSNVIPITRAKKTKKS